MADVIATVGGGLSGWVQTAHDRLLYFGLRSEPVFRAVADVKPVLQTAPGSSVTFRFLSDLSQATATLNESTDVDRVDMATTNVSVSVAEQGNAVGTTALLRATALMDVDAGAIDLIAYNCVDSLDALVRDILVAGTNVRYANGRVAVRAGLNAVQDLLVDADTRFVAAKLRGNKAVPKRSNYYVGFIHPDVSFDYRAGSAQTGSNWKEAHAYASPDAIYAGEIGAINGIAFIETPRGKIFTDTGSSPITTDVYATVVVGQQALAEAVAIEPHIVQSPVVDRLRRFVSHGWYALIGWSRFREAALYRIETASTIGAN